MSNSVKLLIFSCVVNFIIIVLSGGFKLFIKDKRAAVLRFGLIFSNFGFMGFPVIESIYGSKGVLYAAIFNIPFNILVWTYGIYIMNDNKIEGGYKKAIFNEGTIATFVGIFLFLFSIKLPYPIQRTTEIIGGMTTPLSMIIIGSMLGGIELKETLRGLELYVFAFLRLLVAPVIALIVVYLIGGRGITLGIPVVITGMPAAATTAIYAQVYSPEVKAFASKAVFISTIFSLISIPLIIYIIKMITG